MEKICEIFRGSSNYVKNWLCNQPEVKEESLTDWFLYDISLKLPSTLYKQFSRYEEGRKTGADWEWWFVFSDKESFTLRVQAKKLKKAEDNYPGIAYTSNNKLQIEKLIEDSEKEKFASFYAFYSYGDNSKLLCSGGKGISEGVFFAEAKNLKKNFIDGGRTTLLADDVLKLTNPISCFFCCPITGFESQKFKSYLDKYFPTYSSINFEKSNENELLGFNPTPNYILKALEQGEIPEWWETEFRRRFSTTKSVMLTDLRDETSG